MEGFRGEMPARKLVESAEIIKPGLEAIARFLKENAGVQT